MRRAETMTQILAYRPSDPAQEACRTALVSLLSESEAPLSRSQHEPGHVTASGIVLSPDGEHLLLIHHQGLGRWLQPGGHLELGDADLVSAARREVLEETGIEVDVAWGWRGTCFDLDVHEIPANPDRGEAEHRHFDVRVLFRARTQAKPEAGEGVTSARWVPLDEIAALDTDASVLRCVDKVRMLRAQHAPQLRHAPATSRNRAPLAKVLQRWVEPGAFVLEVASGTGEHAQALAPALQVASWQPTEAESESVLELEARGEAGGVAAIAAPALLDVRSAQAPPGLRSSWDVVFCANMIHIAPIEAMHGLLRLSSQALRPGGRLCIYGPFRALGAHTAPTNAVFDEDLRRRDPRWGVRDLEIVVSHAAELGLAWVATESMPANNLTLVFERRLEGVPSEAAEVLSTWFGASDPPAPARRRAWWSHDPAFDAELTERFGATVERALAGDLDEWAATPQGLLALVLVLDQFTRQIHRGGPGMFAGDAAAQRWSQLALARKDADALTLHQRLFLWMPFMHAEDRELQALSMAVFRELAEDGAAAGQSDFSGNLDFADRHRVIVERFGRYPHRNAALGRPSSPEELAFLEEPGSSF